jgi:hypothetical protein
MAQHGAILSGGREIAATLQCCHCGSHFENKPGSGARRQWCSCCSAVGCGQPLCDVCVPFEAKLEYAEGRKNKYWDAIAGLELIYGRYW